MKKIKRKEDDFDWRFEAVTSLKKEWKSPFTGKTAYKGDITYKITGLKYNKGNITFPSIDTVALFLNLSKINYDHAKQLYRNLPIKNLKKLNQNIGNDSKIVNFYESIFSSIIFAFTSVEAFTNYNIPEDYIYKYEEKGQTKTYNKSKIERYVNIEDKLLNILPDLFNKKLTKQQKCWHKFKKLKNFRDRIIHPKYVDLDYKVNDLNTIWNDLFSDKLIKPYEITYKLFEHFIKNSDVKPRWYQLYPYDE